MGKTSKEKLTELFSTIGVGVVGFGLGTLLSDYFSRYTTWIILIGLIMHSAGMYELRFRYKSSTWTRILYWLCWIILFGLTIYIAVI